MNPELKKAYDKIVIDTVKHFKQKQNLDINPHYIAILLNNSTILSKFVGLLQLPELREIDGMVQAFEKIFVDISNLAYVAGAMVNLKMADVTEIIAEVDRQLIPLLKLHISNPTDPDPETGLIVKPS